MQVKWKKYFLVYEVSFLSLMAALVYVFKTFFRTPIQLPGHTAIVWVIPFIVGIGMIKKFGSGTYIGVISGLLIGMIGMADTGILKVFEYTAMGLTMDILALAFKDHMSNVLVGFVFGAIGSFDKTMVNYFMTSILIKNANIILAGIGFAGSITLIFGGLGGIISALIVSRTKSLHFPSQQVNKSENSKFDIKDHQ